MEHLLLRNGNLIPCVGLGTWQITDKDVMADVVGEAYKAGYRLIDTAAAYSNEIALAKAILSLGIERNELIISDKVWNTSRGYDAVQNACKKSLKKLKTDYLDIYLIHWPASMKLYPDWADINADTWRGMEQLYKDGLVRNIGVCNFKKHHLEELKKTAEIMPFIDQTEFHPGLYPNALHDYCKKEGIVMEASSPLGNGQILENPVLRRIADQKKVQPATVCLKWEIQKGVIVIPKTSNRDRLYANMDVFGFELNDDELDEIDNIPYCGGIGIDSDEVIEFG